MQTLSPFHQYQLMVLNIKLSNLWRIFQSSSLNFAEKEQYIKNFAILKSEFQKLLPFRELTEENLEIAFYHLFQSRKEVIPLTSEKIARDGNALYVFLSILSLYESRSKTSHFNFTQESLMFFAGNILSTETKHIKEILCLIFKQNLRNYLWTNHEDELLQNIIRKYFSTNSKKNWKFVSEIFNQSQGISQTRKPYQCKERWENSLKTYFKKGEWTYQEDIFILDYVLRYGFKWANISKILVQRTEHCLKNRFFSLMALSSSISIRRLKEDKLYLNQNLILDSLAFHQSFIEPQTKTQIIPNNEETARNQGNLIHGNNHYFPSPFNLYIEQNLVEQQPTTSAMTIPFHQGIPGGLFLENSMNISFFPLPNPQWRFNS